MSPSAYRRRHGSGEGPRETAFPPDLTRQLEERRLEDADARVLMSYLRRHHPEVVEDDRAVVFADAHPRSAAQKRRITNPEIERLLAERLWCAIELLPRAIQNERIQIATLFTFSTPALFEFLKDKSLEVGRSDRDQGVELAELALVAAQAFERPELNTGTSTLLVRAWAALGNMRRLSFDLKNAERAFLQAEHFLPDDPPPRVHGRFLNLKALLRWYQHLYHDGLSLADKSIAILEKTDDTEALAKVLIDRAILCRYMGRLESGVETLLRALDLLPKLTNSHRLYLAAYYNLARYYRELGLYTEVEDILEMLRAASARSDLHIYDVHIDWFEGRVALDQEDASRAERSLLVAHSGFLLAGAKARAGFVALDLTIAYTLQEKKSECIHSAQEALMALDMWRTDLTLERAWRTLKRSLITRTFHISDLIAIRDAVDHFQDDPTNERHVELSLAG